MSLAASQSANRSASRPLPIRVMVVDDSAVARSMLTRWIDADPDFKVAAVLRDGRAAVDQFAAINPDVVILDIDMPVMDGITALPLLLAQKRDLVVIMASTLTRRHAEISIRALTLGAADYVPKPDSTPEATEEFRRELLDKMRALGTRKRRPSFNSPPLVPSLPTLNAQPSGASPAAPRRFSLLPFPTMPPRVLLIGASTGGPQALTTVLTPLGGIIDQAPVLITQHMPPTFTAILAEHLSRATGRPAREAVHNEPIEAGHIYIARGGRHMRVERRDGVPSIALSDDPPINFCRPAVDPLFSSAAEVWAGWNMALVLTGMGSDGAKGAADIVRLGGCVIAQDEATSVVWGMPGATAQAGLCSAVLPLDQIAPRIMRAFGGGVA